MDGSTLEWMDIEKLILSLLTSSMCKGDHLCSEQVLPHQERGNIPRTWLSGQKGGLCLESQHLPVSVPWHWQLGMSSLIPK